MSDRFLQDPVPGLEILVHVSLMFLYFLNFVNVRLSRNVFSND